jgi:hypothetical protein
MGLKIANKIKENCNFNAFPTSSDTIPTITSVKKTAFPTNRRIRHPASAANDEQTNADVSHDGMPLYFYDGGSNGCHYGDREWILRKLRRIQNKADRTRLAAEYSKRFKVIYDAEPIEHKKNGKARFSSNGWLLHVTK